MHRTLTARWLNRALKIGDTSASIASVPLFLCPAVGSYQYSTRQRLHLAARSSSIAVSQRRANHSNAAPIETSPVISEQPIEVIQGEIPTQRPIRKIPLTCSGCGAFTQTDEPLQLGYVDSQSKRVRTWMQPRVPGPRREDAEDKIVAEVLKGMDKSKLKELGIDPALMIAGQDAQGERLSSFIPEKPPVCERCHNLRHYSTTSDTAKVPMYHPTVESLRETIEESPHKYNHIYHVIDAADFPMSLIPRLNVLLGDIPIRTKNRRSRASKFQHDRKTEISFIITRGDLLGPTKDIVDSMMPYLREVLRDALGRLGGRVRLGNVKCVSARRGWWTKAIKEDIWKRGGAGWMVGKVNVGKSQLFEAVYPKGRMVTAKPENGNSGISDSQTITAVGIDQAADPEQEWHGLDVGDLLPPAQPETNYPEMPLVSSLPGTTASPIRVPFGNGRGELIDLPGLARGDLELFVKEEHRQSLIMKKRIVPEQISLKEGHSLLLGGGLIRITPKTPNVVFLMYNFTPIDEHLTMNEKAIGFQHQTRQSIGVENITLPGAGEKMKHAGTFKLCHDVTKRRAGPLTRKNAVGLQVDRLPFRVLSTDILIEGVGYVEIVAQVRAKDVERWTRAEAELDRKARREEEEEEEKSEVLSVDPFADMINNRKENQSRRRPLPSRPKEDWTGPEIDWPAVDIYTPDGRFVGSRQPINGWLNNKPRVLDEHKKSRPRRSMKGQKKMAKIEKRAGQAASAST